MNSYAVRLLIQSVPNRTASQHHLQVIIHARTEEEEEEQIAPDVLGQHCDSSRKEATVYPGHTVDVTKVPGLGVLVRNPPP